MEGELVAKYRDAVQKRKRAEEEIVKSYDALFEWNKQDATRIIMEQMGDDVERIDLVVTPKGDGIFSTDKTQYAARFKDGTIVTGDEHGASFDVGSDTVVKLRAANLKPGFTYKDRKKLARERVNKHLPAIAELQANIFWLHHSSLKRRTDAHIREASKMNPAQQL